MSTITITGNLTRDPELRFTPSGKAVANLGVAENHRRRDDSGEWVDGETTYWRVSVWGDQAEHVAESLAQGHLVVVVGRTGTRVWTPTDGPKAGEEQRSLEVIADTVAPSLRWATAKLTKAARNGAESAPQDGEEPPF